MNQSQFKNKDGHRRIIFPSFWIAICLGAFTFLWYVSFTPGFEGHHENANALVLISLDQWLSQGPLASYFAPALSYPGKNNAFVDSSGIRLFSEMGSGFYTSAGAYSIWLPYLILQIPLFSLSPEALIHLLALTNVIISAVLLFVIVRRHTTSVIAGYATTYFLVQPLVSQLGGHLWSWDSGWLIPWLALLVLTSSLGERTKFSKSVLIFIAALLASYNDHQGVILVVVHSITMLCFRKPWSIIVPALVGLTAAVLVTEISYAQISGLSNLLTSQQGRFTSRMLGSIDSVRFDILLFSAVLITAPLLSCVPYGRTSLAARDLPGNFTMLIVSTLCGSLLDFALFPQWHEAHYFSLLKLTVPLTLLASLWMTQVSFSQSFLRRILLIALLAVTNILSLDTRDGSSLQRSKKLGLLLKERVPGNYALAVITSDYLWAPVIYHAKRNFLQVNSYHKFTSWLQFRDVQHGILLYLNSDGTIISEEVVINSKLAES